MTTKLVSRKELCSVFGIPYCHQHIARLEKAGEFPKSRSKKFRFVANALAWSRAGA